MEKSPFIHLHLKHMLKINHNRVQNKLLKFLRMQLPNYSHSDCSFPPLFSPSSSFILILVILVISLGLARWMPWRVDREIFANLLINLIHAHPYDVFDGDWQVKVSPKLRCWFEPKALEKWCRMKQVTLVAFFSPEQNPKLMVI